MELIKKILKKAANPGKLAVAFIVCLFVAALCGAVVVFVRIPESPWGYVLSVCSAFLFGYLVYVVVLACLYLKPFVIGWAQKYSFTRNFVGSYEFRTMILAAGKFVLNIGYAAFNGVYGILFQSPWYIALFVYYLVLCIARGSMVVRSRKVNTRLYSDDRKDVERIRIYRAAGILLLVFTVALNGMLLQMRRDSANGFRYTGMLIFVAAGYTVYKVIMAVYNLVKSRGSTDYVVHAVRNINFADALVSVLALQSAVSVRMAAEDITSWAGFVLGSAICLFTATLGIYMIVKAQRKLKNAATRPSGGNNGLHDVEV